MISWLMNSCEKISLPWDLHKEVLKTLFEIARYCSWSLYFMKWDYSKSSILYYCLLVGLMKWGVDPHLQGHTTTCKWGLCWGDVAFWGNSERKSFVQYILSMIQISSNVPLLASGFLRWVDALLWLWIIFFKCKFPFLPWCWRNRLSLHVFLSALIIIG